MRNIEDICLVITGCMHPDKTIPILALQSGEKRERQYLESISYALEKTKFKNIIYCDSSNTSRYENMVELARLNNKNFEWLCFTGNNEKIVKRGKGYGEGEIMKFIVNNSALFEKCNYFAKITGRLELLNTNWLFNFCDINHNYFSNFLLIEGKPFVDTRFFMIKKEDYVLYFMNCFEKINDIEKYYLEHAYAEVLLASNIKFYDFPIALNIYGVSGSNGNCYSSAWWRIYIKTLYKLTKYNVMKLYERIKK